MGALLPFRVLQAWWEECPGSVRPVRGDRIHIDAPDGPEGTPAVGVWQGQQPPSLDEAFNPGPQRSAFRSGSRCLRT